MTPYQRIIITLTAAAFFMEGLDSSIMNTSLPQIAFSLHTSPLHLKIALTTYLLTAGIFIPISGWLADKFGTKVIFRFAILTFLIGSIICGLSQNVDLMVLGRIIQGLGGALSLPVGRLLFVRNFSKEEFVYGMSITATYALIAPSIGPFIGGALTTYLNWRFIFFVNIPVGLFSLYYVQTHIKNEKDLEVKPFDFFGFILLGLSLACLLFSLDTIAEPLVKSKDIAIILGSGLTGIISFIFYAHKKTHPVISPELFKDLCFRHTIINSFWIRISLAVLPFMGPLLLQMGLGMTAMQSGLYTGSSALAMLASKPLARLILKRYPMEKFALFNSFLISLSLNLYTLVCFYPKTSLIFTALIVNGALASLQFSTMNALAYSNLNQKLQSMGTSFISSFQQIVQSFGIATAAFILTLALHHQTQTTHYATDAFALTYAIISLLPLISCFSLLYTHQTSKHWSFNKNRS